MILQLFISALPWISLSLSSLASTCLTLMWLLLDTLEVTSPDSSTAMTINHKDLVPGEVVVFSSDKLICVDVCLLMSKDVFVWKKTPIAPSKRAVVNTCQHEYADSLLPFLSAISCHLLLCSVASQPSTEEATFSVDYLLL
ncbi:unnamed protein product [Sphagnum balticum]